MRIGSKAMSINLLFSDVFLRPAQAFESSLDGAILPGSGGLGVNLVNRISTC